MRVAVLFSGGKDSTFALYKALLKGHEVKCLVSIVPESRESYMFHYPNIRLTALQAEAMEIPIITGSTAGEKERELKDLEAALKGVEDIEGVVVGALASRYQRERVEAVCSRLGLEMISPLWDENPEKLWNELLATGFKVMITAVAADGLGKEWLGRVVDKKALGELKKLSEKHKFHLMGEGGEMETLVLDCPLFRRKLEILEAEKIWEQDSGYYLVKNAKLVEKQI